MKNLSARILFIILSLFSVNTVYQMEKPKTDFTPVGSSMSVEVPVYTGAAGTFTALTATTFTDSGTATIAGKTGIGTTTPPSLLTISSQPVGNGTVSTTTSDYGDFSTTTSRGCYNTKNAEGAAISFYFMGTSMIIENNRCK